MDEALLTIRFKDESSPAGTGVATTSPQYSGSDPGSVTAAEQQSAITAAGGVGAMAAKNNQASAGGASPAAPPPVQPAVAPAAAPATTAAAPGSGDPLMQAVQGIVAADANVTAAELAQALGIPQGRAQALIAATVNPGGQQAAQTPSTPPPAAPGVPSQPPPPMPPPVPPPVQTAPGGPQIPRPPDLTLDQLLDRAQHNPPPLVNPPPPADPGHGVQNAVDSIARLGHFGGPAGSLAAQAAAYTVAQPGMASGIAAAVPAIAAVAPYVAAVGGAVAFPVIAASVVQNAVDRAAGQIGNLSPEVAMATAQANVNVMMANLRSAEALGDEVADNIRIRSRAEVARQGRRDIVMEPIFQQWNDIANGLTVASEALTGAAQENREGVQAFIRGILQAGAAGIPGGLLIQDLLRRLNDRMEHEEVTGNLLNIFPRRPTVTLEHVFGKSPTRTSGLSPEFGMW